MQIDTPIIPGNVHRFRHRLRMVDYLCPDTDITASRFALLFGSRTMQPDLVSAAVQLFSRGYYETLIVTGGCTADQSVSEALELARQIVGAGIPRNRVLLEEAARNTAENVRYTRALYAPLAIKELLLIGKIYAKRRYVMTIQRQWPEIKRVSCFAVNPFGVPRHQWWTSPALRSRIVLETRKIRSYLQCGDISEVEVIDRHFALQADRPSSNTVW